MVSVFNSRYMAAPMDMIVLGRKWSLEGGIVLTLRATSAAIYADGTAFDAPLIPPASLLPLPWSVAPPSGMAISSDPDVLGDATQTARMQVTWTLHQDAAVRNGGAIETQYRPADEPEPAGDWPSSTESGRATNTTIRGVQQNRYYLVRQRAWNGPAASEWGVQQVHKVSASPLVATANLAPRAASAGTVTSISSGSGGSSTVGAVVLAPFFLGPTKVLTADDEIDFDIQGEHQQNLFFDVAVLRVEVWITRAPSAGGASVEIGKRRNLTVTPEAAANVTKFPVEILASDTPGAGSWRYTVQYRVRSIDSAGVNVSALAEFENDAQWRDVQRMR